MTTNERRRRAFARYNEAYEQYSDACDEVKEYAERLIERNGKSGWNGSSPYCNFASTTERKEYNRLIARALRYERRAGRIQAEIFKDFWED